MVAAALVLCTYPAIASAAITPTQDAGTVAGAMTDGVSETGAAFTDIPPTDECENGQSDDGDEFTDFPDDPQCASPNDDDEATAGEQPGITTTATATSDVALTAFPTAGSTYAILSSGNTLVADDPNSAPDTSFTNFGNFYPERVGRVFDLVTLRVDLNVPASANCLRLDFRFLSEEFPEFVTDVYNDAFVAELDDSNFTADPSTAEVNAPNNFAFAPRADDPTGNDVVSVKTAGMNAANAAGTTYDGATPLLQASTPVTAGGHSVFLTIFDQGDNAYDSAVFLDNLVLANAPPGSCVAGASDETPPETTIVNGPADGGATNLTRPTFEVASSEPNSTFECSIDGGEFQECEPETRLPTLSDDEHTFRVRATDAAGNVDPTPASRTFRVDTAAPETTITAGPVEGETTMNSAPTFGLAASEASTFECSVDGGPFQVCGAAAAIGPLAPGSHTFAARATDAAGNVDLSPATRTFTVAAEAPPEDVPQDLPPGEPEVGRSVNVTPVEGTVSTKCPGDASFTELRDAEQIPVGCLIDTRNGTVLLTSSRGTGGGTQSAEFWDGLFRVKQKVGRKPFTELVLAGSLNCGKKDRPPSRKDKGGRGLWGDGDGKFSSRGHRGAGSSRGTKWFVGDRCNGSTYVKVNRGVVSFRDFVDDKTVIVRAGESYATDPRKR